MDASSYLASWRDLYRDDLAGDIIPFWLKHGLDRVNGGVYTCLDRDGTVIDTTKSVWFQGRFGFVMPYAFNNVEKRGEWLEAARSAIEFSDAHCYDSRGRMYFETKADGTPLRMRRYVFSECFACMAKAEFALATGESRYAEEALALFKRIRGFMADGARFMPPKYEPALETRGHSLTMMLINVALCVKKVSSDPALDEQIEASFRELSGYFVHPEFKALLETVGPNGEFIDTIAGRTINPGHCIETAWFLLDAAASLGRDDIRDAALQILDWSWEWGWDREYGGLASFKDCRNLPPQCYEQDMKFWWPHCEAIIAALYAYKVTRDEKYLRMHRLVSDWTYSHFPDREYGEWYGYLHRDGSVAQRAKGNIFKGPFHIPRMMVKSFTFCNEILAG